jgi:UDP-N-acetylmuramoyl-tripeptide--D-alanyl-D-alanine ligase
MITFKDIVRATQGYPHHLSLTQSVAGFSINSRTLNPNDLFIAIRGAHFDGHDFIREVMQKGAIGCVVDKAFLRLHTDFPFHCIEVENTDVALRQIAHAWRMQFHIPALAITGSCGKTTTKEMTKAVLESRFSVLASVGNFNNQYGLPLTLFQLNEQHQILLAEIGANHQGEIRALCETLEPQYGLITNVGPVHVEGFGGLEGVYRGKLELGEFLGPRNGTLIVRGDDPELVRRARASGGKVLTFGMNPACDYEMTRTEPQAEGLAFYLRNQEKYQIKSVAQFNAFNALGAVVLGKLLGLTQAEIQAGFDRFEPVKGRFEIKTLQEITFVFDAYNANPASFKVALEAFFNLSAPVGRRWVVCGDMLELGEESVYWHTQVGEALAQFPVSALMTIGQQARVLGEACRKKNSDILTYFCKDNKEAAEILKHQLKEGDNVFLKGSRGMKLEQILDTFSESGTHV